ncbi:MAG: response regulator [Methylococcaceae bacterium]|jgi:FixJ family two-component response regulator
MTRRASIYIIDDDLAVREALCLIIENAGFNCQAFNSAEEFLSLYKPVEWCCLLLDVNLPGINGHELQAELSHRGINLPIIFLSAYANIPMTVRAIKSGAADFLTKPVPSKLLIERIESILLDYSQQQVQHTQNLDFRSRIKNLTLREMQVLPLVIAGHANKEIAQKLGISHRTVETHRARILKKTNTANFLELSRISEGYAFLKK